MPVLNSATQMKPEVAAWRQHIHQRPELMFDCHETAAFVVERLKSFGVDDIVTGLGQTGVVGVIKGRSTSSGKVIGLRADMDALPIEEATLLPYASKVQGKMHACGHDGHTAMLLGAAKYLCETRNFDGTVIVIFQPAEEGGGGGRAMVEDGLMDRFAVDEVFGMHNAPGLPVGHFALRKGPLMAAADRISIVVEGKGAHAAKPHMGIDTILVAAQIVQNVQAIVARNIDPLESAVVSICKIEAGFADNVIPQSCSMLGTVRTLTASMRDYVEKRLGEVVEGTAALHGATAKLSYFRDYPVTVNHDAQTDFAIQVARDVVGHANVRDNIPPTMGGEDFSFMLEARPGAFIFIGQGESAGLHHPAYNFNDEIIPIGISYWARLVETAMPARS